MIINAQLSNKYTKPLLALLVAVSFLTACSSSSGQPAVTTPAETTGQSAAPLPSPSVQISTDPQELRFYFGVPNVNMYIGEQGRGFMLTSGGSNVEELKVYPIEAFKVLEQKHSYPEFRGRDLAAHTTFINSQGQGQILAINTASAHVPGTIGTGIPTPPIPTALVIRSIDIQNFMPVNKFETISFKEIYTYIEMNKLLVDENGNGHLSLQVRENDQDSNKLILIPIQNHRLQAVIDTSLDLPANRYSHQNRQVWVNAEKNGLLVDMDEKAIWKATVIRQGKLSAQSAELGTSFNVRGLPVINLNAQGQGSLFISQDDGTSSLSPIDDFVVGPAVRLPVPLSDRMTAKVARFKKSEGTIFEFSVANPLSKTRTYTFYHVDQGRLVGTKTLTQDIPEDRLWDSPSAISVNSQGQGLFAWSTLQRFVGNGELHIQPIQDFMITGPEKWISPNQGKAPLNVTPTPSITAMPTPSVPPVVSQRSAN